MTNKPPFKQAKQKLMTEVEHGDIIVYQPPGSSEWKRGIVYNKVASPRTKALIGHIILPVETIGYEKKIDEYSVSSEKPQDSNRRKTRDEHSVSSEDRPETPHWRTKTNGTIVKLAGGTPRDKLTGPKPTDQKTIVYYNFVNVYNGEVFVNEAGQKDMRPIPKAKLWVMGTYMGSSYHAELLRDVEAHYKNNEMYREGKKIAPGTPINIVKPQFAEKQTQQLRDIRDKVETDLISANRRTGVSSFESIAKDQRVKKRKEPKAPVHKEPSVPLVAKDFDQARQYDVRLKDLFLLVNAGGERLGIVRMLGTTPEGIQDNEGVASIIDPSKDRDKITLRDVIKSIEEKGEISEIAKALQEAGSISATSTQKSVTKLKELHEALLNVKTVDGKPTSSHDIVSHLINDNKLEIIAP